MLICWGFAVLCVGTGVAIKRLLATNNKQSLKYFMAKTRLIKLAQNADDTFSVLSFSNTAQLSIGQIVSRDRLAYWAGLSDVRTIVVPAPREEESDLDEQAAPAFNGSSESDFEIQPGAKRVMGADFGGDGDLTPEDSAPVAVQADAREFDKIMFEHAVERNWATDFLIECATQADPSDRQMGTMGIKARIIRSNAIASVRRNCVKDLGGDFDNAGKIQVRAALLGKLREVVSIPLPF